MARDGDQCRRSVADCVAARTAPKNRLLLFLAGNILWVIWGWHAQAWAMVVLQVCLVGLNVRGVKKNEDDNG